jgi:class 3 adenylate cyclase
MSLLDEQALIYARELARLYRLQLTYERLLPTAVDTTSLGGMEPTVRVATALFSDLRGFTGLAERFAEDPSGLLAVVNEHLTAVVRAITRCGGIIEKFVGDGVFATFGARDDLPDHAERALAAAMATVGSNERLNRRWAEAWGFRLEVAVGAAAGKVVVGTLGPPERAELGILGDPVNVAARLVERAKPGEVLVAASVYDQVTSKLRAEMLGRSALRGRAEEVDVYRIPALSHH